MTRKRFAVAAKRTALVSRAKRGSAFKFTLSENARIVIDRYVYDPEQGVGDVLLTTTQGAFRFATGKMKELTEKTITVETPVAQVGVRGTEFWGGPVDGEYSVLLLAGEVKDTSAAPPTVSAGRRAKRRSG